MASAHLTELRLDYLRNATHLLAISSPSASSFLGSARDRLLGDAELEVSSKDQGSVRLETCGACGNVMIPGWSCKIRTRPQVQIDGNIPEKKPREPKHTRTTTVYSCSRCNRETSQLLKPKPRRRLRGSNKSLHGTVTSEKIMSRLDDTKSPKSVNTNSKQRQKARKGGLQAMLEKTKTQSSSQAGLDLMDFAM